MFALFPHLQHSLLQLQILTSCPKTAAYLCASLRVPLRFKKNLNFILSIRSQDVIILTLTLIWGLLLASCNPTQLKTEYD